MIFIKYLLQWGGIAMLVAAVALLAYDLYLFFQATRKKETDPAAPALPMPAIGWRVPASLFALAWVPILLATGIVVVPSGTAGVRVSQTSGTLPGTLYPGAHFLTPLAENIVLFDTRDQLFTTGAIESAKAAKQAVEPLRVPAKEGLPVGLSITVRYRLDSKHLDYIQAN